MMEPMEVTLELRLAAKGFNIARVGHGDSPIRERLAPPILSGLRGPGRGAKDSFEGRLKGKCLSGAGAGEFSVTYAHVVGSPGRHMDELSTYGHAAAYR